ncbi:MAG: SDR family NAD(P)-dependent oxidoreductase [Ilumatobacter sp.]|uniref:SDR family NAD(P)-dependent oxidoreductase n=1 Tax=Ilumatobacter sp. TaxID=1967498 RepID=UPI002605D29A|nr:SDR family NAD(P)-dependent oxidoreductase [Ilumatobacter sp.]MDJ0771065.1 SDR family NAD(P)-dependent oxidoreductase [Ilumatobacter sp.]
MDTPGPITNFDGLTAVVTGGGTGMGRELVRQLAAAGCDVAMCDVSHDEMTATSELARAGSDATISSFVADVSDEAAMRAFAGHVAAEHGDTVNLLFNNAGIGGGGSVVVGDREEWDRVFAVCWGGVLNGTRAFLPLLQAADRGHVVNTSSVNGLWACLGPTGAHTAYSAAKFAVRGFTEALMIDFRVNAPHLTASVVMPGHIGTMIVHNSMVEFGRDPKDLSDEFVSEIRETMAKRGFDVSGASDEDIRNLMALRVDMFQNAAPTSAAEAATVILEGVREGKWRILIGEDAHVLDQKLRERPHDAYSDEFMAELFAAGHFGGLIQG